MPTDYFLLRSEKCGFVISLKIKDLDPLSNLGKIVNPISLILKNEFLKECYISCVI